MLGHVNVDDTIMEKSLCFISVYRFIYQHTDSLVVIDRWKHIVHDIESWRPFIIVI